MPNTTQILEEWEEEKNKWQVLSLSCDFVLFQFEKYRKTNSAA